MNSNFYGRSVAFPIRPDGKGGIATVEGVDSIEDSIRAIISSLKGSHLHEPFLGLPSFVFQPINSLVGVAEVIKDAIIWGEDRVDPASLIVEVAIGDEGMMTANVSYTPIGHTSERTLRNGFRSL